MTDSFALFQFLWLADMKIGGKPFLVPPIIYIRCVSIIPTLLLLVALTRCHSIRGSLRVPY